ncbi:nitrilase [Hortaea werneckii]|nr:nitrilase [Hortaea werneckii]
MLRAAACHASPVFLSARGTTDKCLSLIQQTARSKANLAAFPESFIPAFPLWSSLRPPTANHDFFHAMAKESIYADGEEVGAIRASAKQHQIAVSLGISEKDGEIVVHHRKLMPTFFEKLTWSPGDGHGLRVAETRQGRVGNLICGENTNPLARYALMAQREQLHISTWPAVWPTRAPNFGSPKDEEQRHPGTTSKARNYDNVTANRTRAAAHCFEAKCFGMLCSGHLSQDAIEAIADGSADSAGIKSFLESSPRGVSMFLDPTGAVVSGFTVTNDGQQQQMDYLQNEEGVLYADLNLEDCIEGKQYHDVVGGYQRLDVFKLSVNRERKEPIVFEEVKGTGVTSKEAEQ